MENELAIYFPKHFKNTRKIIAQNTLVLAKINAQLDLMIKSTPTNQERANHSLKELLRSLSPDIWNVYVEGNKEIEYETSFNQLLLSVCSELNLDSETVPTFDFYNAVSLIEKRHKN